MAKIDTAPSERRGPLMNRSASRWVTFVIVSLFTIFGAARGSLAENTAVTPAPGGGERWMGRHEAINQRVKEDKVDLLFIGDSIVQNWKFPEDGKPVWDQFYGKRHPANLGISGDRTEQVLWRLTHGNLDDITPKLAIIMIGQNNGPFNTAEEIAEGVTAVVKTVRERTPNTKILLLGIFYRGEEPNEERKKLAKTNTIIAQLADNKTIHYMDICNIFLLPDGKISKDLMPDFEHPSPKGFCVWAEAIEAKVAELMGDAGAAGVPKCSHP